jgi:hypothetical protein
MRSRCPSCGYRNLGRQCVCVACGGLLDADEREDGNASRFNVCAKNGDEDEASPP